MLTWHARGVQGARQYVDMLQAAAAKLRDKAAGGDADSSAEGGGGDMEA